MSGPAVEINDLWFSYEVAEVIGGNAKAIDKDAHRQLHIAKADKTRDGGLSVDAPRRQHDAGTELVQKLQLAAITLGLPKGARCMLIGANGAGKSTLMNVIGGKHMVEKGSVQVLGKHAFYDTSLQANTALLTGSWTHSVNFVGHNVPLQAMEVKTLIASHSAGIDPARLARLVQLLEVDETWNLTTVSDGQRRRVQILCKLLQPCAVMLLDEITTDLDLLARQDLLEWLKDEAEQRGACVVYCTHIFDGLDGWASHVTYILKGELRFSSAVDAIKDLLSVPPEERTNGWGELFCAVQRWLREQRPDMLQMLGETTAAPARAPLDLSSLPPAVVVSHLTWAYKAGGVPALPDLSFVIPRGCRCLLTGANGAGKTTLLRLIGGKHMVPDGQVSVLGRPVFRDLALNTMVAMLSGDWTRSVACVGNGVPFQADFSVGEMTQRYRESLVADGMDEAVLLPRLARLQQLLDIDLKWRLNRVSDGQRRRCQLLLKLLRPSELLLMDEVTTDLDLIARQALLVFLREESEVHGVTVIYSTHIFDGVDDWPTHLLHLKKGGVRYNGPVKDAPPAANAASSSTSGSLFSLVRGWLDEERAERRANAGVVDVAPTPMEVEVKAEMQQKPVTVTASSLLASESLFGGGKGSRAGARGY
jgi:CCR4-NOT complex subunit CAF16